MSGFVALLALTRGGFTAPSYAIFTDLIHGWVCAPAFRSQQSTINPRPTGRYQL